MNSNVANQHEQLRELYSDEREKNEDLLKHLNNSKEPAASSNQRKTSARPKSASKYGRQTESGNISSQELGFKQEEMKEDIPDEDKNPIENILEEDSNKV